MQELRVSRNAKTARYQREKRGEMSPEQRNAFNKAQREARKGNPDRFKSYSLKRDYGISLAEYEELFKKQNGRCAICGCDDKSERSNNNGYKRLSVDHCHRSGTVRGLLCQMCNQGIGALEDSAGLLRKAADYIEASAGEVLKASEQVDRMLDDLMSERQKES